jgi:hypothetical protein
MTDPTPPESSPLENLLDKAKSIDYNEWFLKAWEILVTTGIYLIALYGIIVEAFFFIRPGLVKLMRGITDWLDSLVIKDFLPKPDTEET